MSSYSLVKLNKEGTFLHPAAQMNTEEFVKENNDLSLHSFLVDNPKRSGSCLERYRLHARNYHTIEMSLAYDIRCPHCGDLMKQVGRCLDAHELGVYACKRCDNRK